jgi:uncharacterized protein YqeY
VSANFEMAEETFLVSLLTMSTLYSSLRADIITAVKARDSVTSTALRTADAGVQRASMDTGAEIDDALVLAIMRKAVKNMVDANKEFSKAGREDLVDTNKIEIAILEKYLPAQIAGDQLAAIVDEAVAQSGAESKREMGKVMGILKSRKDAELIDFGAVSRLLQTKLN